MNSLKCKQHDYYNSNLEYKDSYYIIRKSLSCQYMIPNTGGGMLVCFFIILDSYYYLTVDYYLPAESGIIRKSDYYPDYYYASEAFCIKSILTQDKKKH